MTTNASVSFPLHQALTTLLEDHKAKNVILLDVRQLTSLTDTLVICTGNSHRHTKTLLKHVLAFAKAHHLEVLGCEGEQDGEWILVDCIDVVIHIMLPQIREFYNLEKLWGSFS